MIELIDVLTQDPSKYESFSYKFVEPNLLLVEFRSKLYLNDEFSDYIFMLANEKNIKFEAKIGHMMCLYK